MSRPAGRPEIGPKVETRLYPHELDRVDAAARTAGLKRAAWLRSAAVQALPYETLGRRSPLHEALTGLDEWLTDVRDVALDPEEPKQDRECRGAAYAECIHQIRQALQKALDDIPVQEANAAYEEAGGPVLDEGTPEQGELWGRAAGASMTAAVLDALLRLLPVDGERVRSRASLDDPQADQEP